MTRILLEKTIWQAYYLIKYSIAFLKKFGNYSVININLKIYQFLHVKK